ncbi:hypothetical protein EON66_00590, partial [archaeon]
MADLAAAELPPLILHLDLNATIVMMDGAGGLELPHLIENLLPRSVYGTFTSTDPARPDWVCTVPGLYLEPPLPGLISYRDYVTERLYPYKHPRPDATQLEYTTVAEYNHRQKQRARVLLNKFTHTDQPGAAYRPLYERLLRANELPAKAHDGSHVGAPHHRTPSAELQARWDRGYYNLLPAYFQLLGHLCSSGRRFVLAFRTFGTDLTAVVEEHNMWARGEHPYFPSPAGLDTSGLIIRDPHDFARLTRTAHEEEHTSMQHWMCAPRPCTPVVGEGTWLATPTACTDAPTCAGGVHDAPVHD